MNEDAISLEMATGMTGRRHSPVGREYEPEDKDLENIVKHHLDAFNRVVVRDVDPIDLLIHYEFFSTEQKKALRNMSRNEYKSETVIGKVLEMIDDMPDQPKKYSMLIEALEHAGYIKIVQILTGEIIPVNSEHRDHINKNFAFLCENGDPLELLPNLLGDQVISENDSKTIKQLANRDSREAMMELLFVLPTKHPLWYHYFINALLENNLFIAEKIDKDVCAKIIEMKDQQMSLSGMDDKYVSCIPMNAEQTSVVAKVKPSAVYSDIRENIVQDHHDVSVLANNLSAPDKPLVDESLAYTPSLQANNLSATDKPVVDESLTDTPSLQANNLSAPIKSLEGVSLIDFLDLLSDNENSHQTSVKQSASMRVENHEASFKRTSPVGELTSCDGNQPESLCFNSLLSVDSESQTKSSNAVDKSVGKESISMQKLSSFTRDLGERLPSLNTGSFNSTRGSVRATSRNSNDETSLKTASIESNDRVPGDTTSASGAILQGQRDALEMYSGSMRENSQSPPSKVMSDKNIIEFGTMNITDTEPEIEAEEEQVPDTNISLREYQQELALPALQGKNVIIVAPTGSGKTRVALHIIQEHIRNQMGRGIPKVIFLVNQVALANQQGEECLKMLKAYKTKVISGETQRGRKEYLKDFVDKRDILVVTAQVLLDSLVRKEIAGINMFSLMIFDECHHTHANHTFNQIMALYMTLKFSKDPPTLPQIVGLTASVGVGKSRDEEKAVIHIKKLMANLDAEMISTVQNNMQELRTFVALPDEETFTVPKRENDTFGGAVKKLMGVIEQLMSTSSVVKEMDEAKQFEKVLKAPAEKGTPQYTQWVSKLWKESAKLRSPEARRFLNPCRTHLEHYNNALIVHNDARVEDAFSYLDREMKIWSDQAKHMDNNESKLNRAFKRLRAYKFDNCSNNPKLMKLREMVIKAYKRDQENSRGIVFVRTRELAKAIISWMKETPGLRELNPIQFLGQTPHADKGGMTKAEQDDVLKYFKDGKHKLIVATSVAEEGLDISKCNLVIRYDHVTNEIAMVQSRGRGRAKDSKYYVIAEKGTGMAEKEEMNMIREIMMRKAIITLQREIVNEPRKFKKDLHDLQDEAHLDHQLKSLGGKRRLPRIGNFELQCQKCSKFICMSDNLKKVKDAHHVIVDESLQQRVDFMRDETEQCAVETNQPIGKLSCRGCGENLGVISIYKALEFAVPKIEKFLIVDHNGRQITSKKWKDMPVVVSDMSIEDFRNIIVTRQQNGALNDD